MAMEPASPDAHLAPGRPSASPPRPVIDRVATPLSLFLDSSTRRIPAFSREDPVGTMPPADTPEPAVSPRPADDGPEAARERRQLPPPVAPPAYPGAARGYEPSSRDPAAPRKYSTSPPDACPDPPLSDLRPLRTASVRADTRLAQPTPISSASQPPLDLSKPSGSPLGNIAQLEATAERLSMTSSIDDAIRDLHGELKRTDSRRSSILAAARRPLAADAPANDHNAGDDALEQSRLHLSASSSIVSTNTAARHGGYSPAAFVMSPTHSLSGRLRSGSKGAAARSDADFDPLLSRHGPGKSSDRSARSAKISLAEISESEPVALTQAALDAADAAPPIEEMMEDRTLMLPHLDGQELPDHGAPYPVHDVDTHADVPLPLRIRGPAAAADAAPQTDDDARCMSSHSNNTFQQCRDAFIDFDGVHWDSEPEQDLPIPILAEEDVHTPRGPPTGSPHGHLHPESGTDVQYYPARVPAMLNVPPKLSNKVKTVERNQRQSIIMSAMMGSDMQLASPETSSRSPPSEPKQHTDMLEATQHSWLPDPVAGLQDSFSLLPPSSAGKSQAATSNNGDGEAPIAAVPELDGPADAMRRPQRLSALDPDKRKSRTSFLMKLPPQLRASAFFDLPSVTTDVEMKNGSATATLDSMLDASTTAPVGAFTDHTFAVKPGSDANGKKKKKHKSRKSTMTVGALSVEPEPEAEAEPRPKKRSSLMWLRKRNNSNNTEEKRPRSMASAPVLGANDGSGAGDNGKSADGDHDNADDDEDKSESESDSDSDENAYNGPPSTLLAELQMRKREQQQRRKNMGTGFPNGIHATLLEMDTVADLQRKHRQTKRVNLAWEEPGSHVDQNGSDDEDVPLAILAAMHQGAKNKADLDRPMGLMERRALEDNEPLSRRRARLQGLDTLPAALQKRPSVMSLGALGATEALTPRPATGPAYGPEEEDGEDETLGARRRRLAATDGGDGKSPPPRPLSSSFSADLLSHFVDVDKVEAKSVGDKAPEPAEADPVGEETLGQRRRRLQAEREAREREMSHGNATSGAAQRISRRISMADVLAAHPRKELETRVREEEARQAEEARAAAERQGKLAALRKQMPQNLMQPNVDRSGGFRGGAYNDGNGGGGPQASSRNSGAALAAQGMAPGPYGYGGYNRSSVLLNNFKGPGQQAVYGGLGTANHVGAYDTTGLLGGNAAMGLYGGGLMVPMAVNSGSMSMDRVERWRRGVHP